MSDSILETLESLRSHDNDEVAFLCAAAINLYSESLRRRGGRVMYAPSDIKKLFTMFRMVTVIDEEPLGPPEAGRSARFTEEESQAVLEAVDASLVPAQERRRV